MTALPHTTLNGVLDELMALTRDGIRPSEAQTRIRALRERHPETGIELVWEEEAYDSAVHYDALLSLPGAGTISLSFCPDRALPWPLRGAHRWSEADLVRVNTTTMQIDQAIGCLDFLWEDRRLMDRLVNVCLIEEALVEQPIDLSPAELQQAVDSFRRAHRLYSAAETHCWLERRGMTQEQLEKYAGDEAIIAKLRERVTAGEVDAYFQAHRAEFDSARVARIVFADYGAARQVAEQIRSGEMSFFEAAQRQFIESDVRREQSAGLFAVLQRGQAAADLAEALFTAAAGDTVGPVQTDEGFVVAQVLALVPAQLDEPARREITKLLFDEWLEYRRQTAQIEWNWGKVTRVAQSEPVAAV
jgi:putative peptide maturation system protein